MSFVKYAVWVSGVILSLSGMHAQASNVGFLKYAVIANFTEADIQQFSHEYIVALDNNKIGDVHKWINKESGNGGEIMVIKQYRENNNLCRRIKIKSQTKHQSSTMYYSFCKFENVWKIVNKQ